MSKPESVHILIVDDCPSLRFLAQYIIKSKFDGYDLSFAEDAEEAMKILSQKEISLVLTDYQMPGLSGLELLQAMHRTKPGIPVILMSAFENGQIELDALLQGAVGFIPKSRLVQDLPARLQAALPASSGAALIAESQAINYIHGQTTDFIFSSDRSVIPEVVVFCQELLAGFKICSRKEQIRVGIAIEEAVVNGMIHGNLEVGSELRGVDDEAYCKLLENRVNQEPYASRKLNMSVHLTANLARFVIRDEGPGFDVSNLPDPTDPENLMKASGRGTLLIRSFMDELWYNDSGNEITIIKYKSIPSEEEATGIESQQEVAS